jgi:radical SAM protein with 4Fe4S-binding SPASM domain
MSMEVFRTMVDKNPDVSMYILVGWGEMMLNKHFFDMVYYLRSQKKSVALTTNLTLFNDENIDKILNSGIKHITVSMDGIDEVYEKNRQTAFSAIEENLKKLSAKIKENGNEIFLEINSISSPEVMEKEEEMLNRIGPLVDQIRFSSCLDYNNLKKTNRTKPCREFWRGMISVLYDGRVVPCCMDYNASMVIGHVDEDSLQNIWNNEKTRSLRREQLKLQFKRRCATCYEMEPEDGKKVQKRFD